MGRDEGAPEGALVRRLGLIYSARALQIVSMMM